MTKKTMPDKRKTRTRAKFVLDEPTVSRDYPSFARLYEDLRREVVFILEKLIGASGIKIHAIESRVKSLPSILMKCEQKQTNDPFTNFDDLAAARVICLFRSDLDKLKNLLKDNFDVLLIEDKIDERADPLSYQSVHVLCKMKEGFAGPRYDAIADKQFEIQLRTLCMHCWAAVSHYVVYKGDWDVPSNLRMALSALSGLFYVADSEFEHFNTAMLASKRAAEERAGSEAQDINMDTISALLRRTFPEREAAAKNVVSELVQEIKASGYSSVDSVEQDIKRGLSLPLEYERLNKKGKLFFVDAGAVRNALEGVSELFAEARRKEYEAVHKTPYPKSLLPLKKSK